MESDTSILRPSAPAFARVTAPPHARVQQATERAATGSGWLHRLLGPYAQHPRCWSGRQALFVTMSGLALFYLALLHPYWVRGGDSELYLAIARNLVRGEGYHYNGQPVGLVPPGWSLLLAAGMWFTSIIGILKLLLIASVLVYLGCAFAVLSRFASPWVCAAAVAIVGVLQPTWQLSIWFFSDGPFLATSWAALLMAFQAREHWEQGRVRSGALRLTAALTLLAATISIRWTGILWWPIMGLALLEGRRFARWLPGARLQLRLWPRRIDAMWVGAVLCLVVAGAAFFGLRWWIKVDPADLDPRYSTFVAGGYELVNPHGRPTVGTHVQRFLNGPQWLGVVYWNMAARTGTARIEVFFLAALTTIPLLVAGAVGVARRQWIWLGAAMAWVPVMVTWPHAIDRYTLPVAPVLVLGTILGAAWLCRRLDRPIASSRGYVVMLAGMMLVTWALAGTIGGLFWSAATNTGPRVINELFMKLVWHEPRGTPDWLTGPVLAWSFAGVVLALLLVTALRRAVREPAGEGRRLPYLLRRAPLLLVAPALAVSLAYNLSMYALEVWVSRDPVARYEAGAQRALNSIGHYLRQNDERIYQGEIAVASVRPINGTRLETLGERRNAVWVTDRNALDVPYSLSHEPGWDPLHWKMRPPWAPTWPQGQELSPRLVEWLRDREARWYIIMPMQERFLHLRRVPWAEPPAAADGEMPADTDWRLYEITDEEIRRVEVRDQPNAIIVVPGLEDVSVVRPPRAWLPLPYD